MRHSFTYKLLDRIDHDVLQELKAFVVTGPWVPSNDFADYTISIMPDSNFVEVPALMHLYERHFSKFFSLEGHVGSNVSRMSPHGYVPEHSDYSANTYGKVQDSIVKFQIPIITNPGAGLMWKYGIKHKSEALHLEEGGIYAFDNCRMHSSVNFSSEYRYWITSRWNVDYLIDKSILD